MNPGAKQKKLTVSDLIIMGKGPNPSPLSKFGGRGVNEQNYRPPESLSVDVDRRIKEGKMHPHSSC